jgi:hypothetical protein
MRRLPAPKGEEGVYGVLLVASALADEVDALPHGWGRRVRRRKKDARRALREALRALRRAGVVGPRARRRVPPCPLEVAEW